MSKRKMIWVHGTESNQVFRTFVPEEKHSNQLPMMTWADWELLQELHKARAGKSQNVHIELSRTVAPAEAVSLENATACIAELQDQIKDWESKCKGLEDKIRRMADSISNQAGVIELQQAEIASLSKSLQHYRNAYFADKSAGQGGNSVIIPELQLATKDYPGSSVQSDVSKLGGAKGILR
ncbi:MAG: hypothetical protein G3W58_22925 [Pantoea ananatis]|nr:hypothetical protein [Pantoea ananatis]